MTADEKTDALIVVMYLVLAGVTIWAGAGRWSDITGGAWAAFAWCQAWMVAGRVRGRRRREDIADRMNNSAMGGRS